MERSLNQPAALDFRTPLGENDPILWLLGGCSAIVPVSDGHDGAGAASGWFSAVPRAPWCIDAASKSGMRGGGFRFFA